MGRNKELKKQRKYARREAMKVYEKFEKEFDANVFLKPCPKFIPKLFWNFLIWIIIKHK